MTALVARVAEAWRLWDRWPASPTHTADLEAAVQELAGALGVDSNRLRARLAALRCDGWSHLEAIQHAAAEHGQAAA